MTYNDLGIVETYTQGDLNHNYRSYIVRNRSNGRYLRHLSLFTGSIEQTDDAGLAAIVGNSLEQALNYINRNNLTGWGIVPIN